MSYFDSEISDKALAIWADNLEYLPDEDEDERRAVIDVAYELYDLCGYRGIDAEKLYNEFLKYGIDLERRTI